MCKGSNNRQILKEKSTGRPAEPPSAPASAHTFTPGVHPSATFVVVGGHITVIIDSMKAISSADRLYFA